ncbi:MAG TPA: hypothetical protein VGN20_05655 [Mucilaginibacter sp.]|jgi:hypothetical protein
MTSGQLKGALLEFIVRELMLNCGFTTVKADGHYIFAQRGTGCFFINGKGAAHDADVLMQPPIQMPFSYPSRLLFECKSYEQTIGLNVIRNGLGLRYDINEFEIITEESIELRKNNRRANYAIANRERYYYQVGVASIEEFSKPAFEFAANNKIPLLSLRWFLSEQTCDLFHDINTAYLDGIERELSNKVYAYLKDKRPDSTTFAEYEEVLGFLESDEVIGTILSNFNVIAQRCIIGLLETGDMLFLFATSDNIRGYFQEQGLRDNLEARLHYSATDPSVWTLAIGNYQDYRYEPHTFRFYVPERLMSQWRRFNFDINEGYNMKSEFFSRIFIFSKKYSGFGLPFTVVNIDSEWLEGLVNGS